MNNTKKKKLNKQGRNANGEGTIYFHEGKQAYIASITINGVRKTFQSKIKEEVQRKLDSFKLLNSKSLLDKSNMLLKDYISEYLVIYKLGVIKTSSYDTLDNVYRNHIKDSELGLLELGKVTNTDIQKLINEKSTKFSLSRIKKILEVLNGGFKKAILNGYVDKNPVTGVELPSLANLKPVKEISIYSDEDKNKIIENCYLKNDDGLYLYRYGAIFHFILNTGIREGEACAIKWEDIEEIGGHPYITIGRNVTFTKERTPSGESLGRKLKITTPKTKNGLRKIPLNQAALTALKVLKDNNNLKNINSEYILCRNDGKPLNPRNLINCFNSIAKRAGIKSHGIHALRHTFATDALRCGIDIAVVSKLLGHADTQITYKHYIHIIEEQKIHAINVLDKLNLTLKVS